MVAASGVVDLALNGAWAKLDAFRPGARGASTVEFTCAWPTGRPLSDVGHCHGLTGQLYTTCDISAIANCAHRLTSQYRAHAHDRPARNRMSGKTNRATIFCFCARACGAPKRIQRKCQRRSLASVASAILSLLLRLKKMKVATAERANRDPFMAPSVLYQGSLFFVDLCFSQSALMQMTMATPTTTIYSLPNEITLHILSFVPCWDLASAARVAYMEPAVREALRQRSGACVAIMGDSRQTVVDMAARASHWECLCAIRSDRLCADTTLCAAMARAGNMTCLQRAHTCGWAWDAATTEAAATGGHQECLEYAIDNGCPYRGDLIDSVVDACGRLRSRREKCVGSHTCPTSPCSLPNRCRLFDVLVYMIGLGHQWNPRCECLVEAAANGRVDVLDLVHPLRLCGSPEIAEAAARHGQVDCLAYLRSIGHKWRGHECTAALRGGHVRCLEYLHENGCPWGPRDYDLAGYVAGETCCKYARAHGCQYPPGARTLP